MIDDTQETNTTPAGGFTPTDVPPAADEARWYVVHTYSGYENTVKATLERIVENRGIHDFIQDVSVPEEEIMEIKDVKKKTVRRKIYPGYVLVKMGLTDEILREHGKHGLYTTTLFKLKPELLEELNPAIELGRSFIRSEYQRKHASLSLIWRGIGEYVARNPRSSYLFGPVSITAEYNALSKDLIVQFLKDNNLHPEFSKMVKARKPHRSRRLKHLFAESERDSPKDINDISALISEIESDRKGIPILLKHYLKLNGVMLSFNRDPGFSNVIDGLILVDLTLTDPAILKRHLGDSGFERFMRYQDAQTSVEVEVVNGSE